MLTLYPSSKVFPVSCDPVTTEDIVAMQKLLGYRGEQEEEIITVYEYLRGINPQEKHKLCKPKCSFAMRAKKIQKFDLNTI